MGVWSSGFVVKSLFTCNAEEQKGLAMHVASKVKFIKLKGRIVNFFTNTLHLKEICEIRR
ncbi:hypothetical protein PPSC2_12535 [Paenibacillus polymyxa SC2]|uniref:Uncharacterized protein n=1 Tax=Paenibacillus polymyxa (strain SC2) TaxID=886882 RepID=A0A0D5ZCE4_PAEPS|nr:hypothetical protein PPSC2_12535 [Paenibacillus polymyxa SC2]